MKFKSLAFFSVLFLQFSFIYSAQNKLNKASKTFTKSDASNWIYVIKDKTLPVANVFTMDSGVLKISGVSSGYLRTKKSYSQYDLKLEWRWTKKLGNSGVLVHIQPKDTIWPVCYQVQQRADAAGDIICMNGLWAKECSDTIKFTVKKINPSNEKPLGEWNTMQVICKNNTLKVYINGLLQNEISGLTAKSGFIGFQNEGTPMEFRKLLITPTVHKSL
jgi:hypothetical protein